MLTHSHAHSLLPRWALTAIPRSCVWLHTSHYPNHYPLISNVLSPHTHDLQKFRKLSFGFQTTRESGVLSRLEAAAVAWDAQMAPQKRIYEDCGTSERVELHLSNHAASLQTNKEYYSLLRLGNIRRRETSHPDQALTIDTISVTAHNARATSALAHAPPPLRVGAPRARALAFAHAPLPSRALTRARPCTCPCSRASTRARPCTCPCSAAVARRRAPRAPLRWSSAPRSP